MDQTQAEKDTLFNTTQIREDFTFNKQVVEVFDDMIGRSVPFYTQVIEASAQLLDRYLDEGDTVYDLGCSTGSTLLKLSHLLANKKLDFYGVDNAEAMIKKARLKAEESCRDHCISFHKQDITEFRGKKVGAIIVNYTLQFIRPPQRLQFVEKLYQGLRPGGILLLSEKVFNHDIRLNREFIHIYHQFKKAKGYSELEIAKKREALENILVPFSVEENKEMLRTCGFSPITTFFQWFNFCSLIAVKPL